MGGRDSYGWSTADFVPIVGVLGNSYSVHFCKSHFDVHGSSFPETGLVVSCDGRSSPSAGIGGVGCMLIGSYGGFSGIKTSGFSVLVSAVGIGDRLD